SKQLDNRDREKRVLKTEEAQLLENIDRIREQLKNGNLSDADLNRLNKERKQLRKQLKKLREQMSNIGVATADSVDAFQEQKLILERKLNALQQEIQKGNQLHQDELEDMQTERAELREELRLLSSAFERLQNKLLKDFERA